MPENKKFLSYRELAAFVVLFTVFLIIAFPKNTLYYIIRNDNSEAAVKYLQNILKFYPSSRIEYVLTEKYINLGKYNLAEKLLQKQKEGYQKAYYEYLLAKNEYFNKKLPAGAVRKSLNRLYTFATGIKQYDFIYRETVMFNFADLEWKTLKHLEYTDRIITLALALKKYKTALKYMKNTLDKNFDESCFIKMEDLLLYLKKEKESKIYAEKFYKNIKTAKGFDTLLRVSLITGDKNLMEYAIKKAKNRDLKLQAYIYLKEYRQALKILQKTDNYYLLAEVYLWDKNYDKALKYFIKDGIEKNFKIIVSLANYLKKELLLLRMFEQKVTKGNFNYIKDLTYLYTENAFFERGIKFYIKMYKKYKKDIFLNELFRLYYAVGDENKILALTGKFKHLPLYAAFYVSNIYISQMNYQKAYEIMKKTSSQTYAYYARLYYLADKLGLKKDKIKWLKHLNGMHKNPEYINALYLAYLDADEREMAFNVLKSNFGCSDTLLYEYVEELFKRGEYNKIEALNTGNMPEFYYEFLLKIYRNLHKDKKADTLYRQLIYKYPKFKTDYFWFLLDRKDKRISEYLNDIENTDILLGAYLLLGKKYQAQRLLKNKLNSSDIDLLMQYYWLSEDGKTRFILFKKISSLVEKKPEILNSRRYLDFYFTALLKYGSYYKIKKTLAYIKKHDLDYKKYYILYLNFTRSYERLQRLDK